MKTLHNHLVLAFALPALIAALHTAPAFAMGRSGAQASTAKSHAQVTERPSQMENRLQVQIEALRKEVAELKAQQALAKVQTTLK